MTFENFPGMLGLDRVTPIFGKKLKFGMFQNSVCME